MVCGRGGASRAGHTPALTPTPRQGAPLPSGFRDVTPSDPPAMTSLPQHQPPSGPVCARSGDIIPLIVTSLLLHQPPSGPVPDCSGDIILLTVTSLSCHPWARGSGEAQGPAHPALLELVRPTLSPQGPHCAISPTVTPSHTAPGVSTTIFFFTKPHYGESTRSPSAMPEGQERGLGSAAATPMRGRWAGR